MYEIEFRGGHRLINSTWRASVEEAGEYLDPANEYWGFAFTRHPDGGLAAELVGPAPSPRRLVGNAGDQHWGVELRPEVCVAGLPKSEFVGRLVALPITGVRFMLAGHELRIPEHDGLERFVESLERRDILRVDPTVRRALHGDRAGYSTRSWQRRMKSVTGFSPARIRQLIRARAAYRALRSGRTATEVAAALGFADQAHLTRSLVALRAERPSDIRRLD